MTEFTEYPTLSAASPAQVRAWAKENGYVVGNRGKVAATVQDAYAAANG